MVNDAYRENLPPSKEEGDRREEPNLEPKRFFEMLDAAKQPVSRM